MKISEITSDMYVSRALLKIKLNDYSGIIYDLDKAIELDPEDEFAFTQRGIAKFNLKMFNDAIADFKKSIEIIITNNEKNNENKKFGVGNLKYYGKSKLQIGEFKSALKIFYKWLSQYPTHHLAYECIAKCYEKMGDNKNHDINLEKYKQLDKLFKEKTNQSRIKKE